MKKRTSTPSASRRQFLRDGLRYTILGGLAAVTGKLAARGGIAPVGQVCVNEGICRGCGEFDDCGLPQALSAKQAKTNPPQVL